MKKSPLEDSQTVWRSGAFRIRSMIEQNATRKLHTMLVCGQSFFKARLSKPSIDAKRGQLAEHRCPHGSLCNDRTSSNVAEDNDETRSVMRHARHSILASHARFRAVLDYFPMEIMPLLEVFD